MNKLILLEALNECGNFDTVEQEFNEDQLNAIYIAMDYVKASPPNGNTAAKEIKLYEDFIEMVNEHSGNIIIKAEIKSLRENLSRARV